MLFDLMAVRSYIKVKPKSVIYVKHTKYKTSKCILWFNVDIFSIWMIDKNMNPVQLVMLRGRLVRQGLPSPTPLAAQTAGEPSGGVVVAPPRPVT